MPREPHVPDAFDVLTVVVPRRPTEAPEMSDEQLDELRARHLACRAELRRQGPVVANGPFDEQSDPSYRGMSVFARDPAEAARLSDGDPSVVAGRPRVRRDGVVGRRRLARVSARRRPGRRPSRDARRLTPDSGCRPSGTPVTVPSMDMLTGDQIYEAGLADWRKLGQGLHAR